MVDRQGILDHLRELEASLQDWEKYRTAVSLEDLKTDRDKRNMVLHAMLVADRKFLLDNEVFDSPGGWHRAPAKKTWIALTVGSGKCTLVGTKGGSPG